MILVVGSTGSLGSEICSGLAGKGKSVRALVRATADQTKVQQLKSMGVTTVQGDLRDPDSLKAACQGVDVVLSTVSSLSSYEPAQNDLQTTDIDGTTNLIAAAQDTGVTRFIYVSFSGNIERNFPLRNAKRTIEKRLKESKLAYTILRPSYFMESWLAPMGGFDAANGTAQVYGTGDQLLSWISRQDVARMAVEYLDNPGTINATIEMGGPEALSPQQVIKIFEQIGGQAFEVTHVPAEVLQAQMEEAEDPIQQSVAGLMLCYADGDPIDASEFLPAPTVSVKDYARQVLGK